jgi:hypothetical protein
MKARGIHVQHSYEVCEQSVLPQKNNKTDVNATYTMAFDGRSSKEQLVGLS